MPAIRIRDNIKVIRKLERKTHLQRRKPGTNECMKTSMRIKVVTRIPVIGEGFANVGNSCYINAILQALIHLTPLTRELRQSHHRATCILSQSSKWCAMCALSSLATSRYLTPVSRSHKVPSEFTDHLKDLSSSLTPGVQEDAHEFLGILLNGLQNCELGIDALDFTRMQESIRSKTLISRMFEGNLRCCTHCLYCQSSTFMLESFQNTSVSLSASTVEQAMNGMVTEDTFVGENQYYCDECEARKDAVRRTELLIAPKVHVVNLQRFSFDGNKLHNPIEPST
ncbi:hypothetical protein CROQUDRAFT_718150, partial [Cronartium quercuum f. sp. fusiforme G11]